MILEIEQCGQDVLLTGRTADKPELKRQIRQAEQLCDAESGNFTALLCRMFHWDITGNDVQPDYVYDRDTGRLYCPRYRETEGSL